MSIEKREWLFSLATGQVPGPLGSRHPSITPFEAFACADGHLVIAAGNDDLFGKLCAVLERHELADDRLEALHVNLPGGTRFGSRREDVENLVPA